jgi:hypothetical protein
VAVKAMMTASQTTTRIAPSPFGPRPQNSSRPDTADMRHIGRRGRANPGEGCGGKRASTAVQRQISVDL